MEQMGSERALFEFSAVLVEKEQEGEFSAVLVEKVFCGVFGPLRPEYPDVYP
jgi:hypothetical protein